MSNTLKPSFRLPFNIDGKATAEVVAAIRWHDNGLVDLNQAIASLKSQIDAKTVTTVTSTSTSGGGGSTPTPFPFSGLGGVNDQSGVTAYTVASTDNGVLLIVNDASPVAVTLDSALATPYFLFITNFGAGTATLTPNSGLINGSASYTLLQNYFSVIVSDGVNWHASAALLPQTIAPVAGEYLTGYDATTGLFSQSTPAGISVTITTAALTGGGTQGSMTFTGGLLTAQTPAT